MGRRATRSVPRRQGPIQIASFLISCGALFVALGGPSWAADLIGAGRIKNDAVRARHIKSNAVAADEVRAGSIGTAELAAGSIDSTKLADGSVNGAELGAIVVRRQDVLVADGGASAASVPCAAGERLIGGGPAAIALGSDIPVTSSAPTHPAGGSGILLSDGQTPTRWSAALANEAGGDNGDITVSVYALCLR